MIVLASFDIFINRIEFDSAVNSTDLLSSLRRFGCAGTFGVLRDVFSYLKCFYLKYYITTTITFPCLEEIKSSWINR